ncbi:BON domain protein [Micromonospora sp. MW-13]|uniref:BON domain-containing protein n=1 Tax=unclassified Micromonospora TaxID=2617518 RepID=UPI000E43DAC0|nr:MULTISPECIES: BON domain-containing protein [unclassified Micromonospora]MCX4472185.1 BON domain-containing protein [Micromonospora sp. NBC_01655]RGC67710.1 BON domain protein [Micromonospora sp. MW-13]
MVIPWPSPDDHFWTADPDGPEPPQEDTRLAAAVARRLGGDPAVRHEPVTVSVQNRVVILTGIVADPRARRIAGELAWTVTDVVDVCNALRLAEPRRPRR